MFVLVDEVREDAVVTQSLAAAGDSSGELTMTAGGMKVVVVMWHLGNHSALWSLPELADGGWEVLKSLKRFLLLCPHYEDVISASEVNQGDVGQLRRKQTARSAVNMLAYAGPYMCPWQRFVCKYWESPTLKWLCARTEWEGIMETSSFLTGNSSLWLVICPCGGCWGTVQRCGFLAMPGRIGSALCWAMGLQISSMGGDAAESRGQLPDSQALRAGLCCANEAAGLQGHMLCQLGWMQAAM